MNSVMATPVNFVPGIMDRTPIKSSFDGYQRLKNDHELFLEAYEKPTQIYRFLRTKSALEPIFLQRNLSYMTHLNSKQKKRRRHSLKLDKLVNLTKPSQNPASSIKSDNHLKITFQSIDKRSSPLNLEGNSTKSHDVPPMKVDILLYCIQQPTAEVLLANPSSLSCSTQVLGSCVLPAPGKDDVTITVPGSVLSWKQGSGSLGTHMLAFRVTPLNTKSSTPTKNKQSRKRTPVPVFDNHVVQQSESNTVRHKNGLITPCQNDPAAGKNLVNGVAYNKVHFRKAPGGKTLPGTQIDESFLVKIPRNYYSNNIKLHKRRNELQLLVDSDNSREQCLARDDMSLYGRHASHSTVDTSGNGRKRLLNDTTNGNSCGVDLCAPPPPKRSHIETTPTTLTSTATTPGPGCDVFSAELVAFDSRQECLLVDGEYELLLQKCQSESKKCATESLPLKNGSLFNWDSILKINKQLNEDDESQSLYLNFSVKWSSGPPEPRLQDIRNTMLDFVKLKEQYSSTILTPSSSSDSLDNSSLESSLSNPKPTVFNFLYNDNTQQQTQLKQTYTCPWCMLDCHKLYSLLQHMSTCHPRFNFTYSPAEGGACVDVSVNRRYDTSADSDPHLKLEHISLKRKKEPTKCQSGTEVLVAGPMKHDHCLAKFTAALKQFSQPKYSRLYYHPQTSLPLLNLEKDTEDVGVPKWLKITSLKMVDEFIDVNEGEKIFMKIWNLYVIDHRPLADKQIPHLCLKFAQDKKLVLLEKRLVKNFLSHLIYMCDVGLVPPCSLIEIMKIFD